jgi:hypothetical protein
MLGLHFNLEIETMCFFSMSVDLQRAASILQYIPEESLQYVHVPSEYLKVMYVCRIAQKQQHKAFLNISELATHSRNKRFRRIVEDIK